MPHFIVNRDADAHGDHQVHDRNSVWGCLPAEADQRELGAHDECASAVRLALLFYPQVNGCARCTVTCHVARRELEPAASRGAVARA